MSKIKVGVVRGGPSGEYDVSLKTGASVLSQLSHPKFEDKYHLYDIFISKDGTWHMHGVPINPHTAAGQVDVFFNALHGAYGEDGKIQNLLEDLNMPFTGSGSLASAIGMNKILSKEIFKKHGIKTPYHIILENRNDEISRDPEILHRHALTIFRSFPMPAVIKPSSCGSSLGVSVVRDFASIEPALREAFRHGNTVIVEEFIAGAEATVGVVEKFRGENLYALPAIEIRHGKDLFDYEAKYGGAVIGGGTENDKMIKMAEEIVPGNFTSLQKAELERLAKEVHSLLGLKHYSRVDFMVSPRRGIYVLEANTLPGLTSVSLIPKALSAVGATFPDFLDHVVTLAYEK